MNLGEERVREAAAFLASSGVLEFAIVEKDVRVGVCGDREGPLPDAGADEGSGFALSVPEADAAVAQVMRRPRWCA